MTPWWLDTCQAALVIGVLPLAACSLQGTSEIALARWGSVQGSGTMAFSGLMLLTLIFPFMLALLGRELCLLSQSGGLGRAFAVAACSVVGCFVVAHAAADVDGTALATDDTLALFRHRRAARARPLPPPPPPRATLLSGRGLICKRSKRVANLGRLMSSSC